MNQPVPSTTIQSTSTLNVTYGLGSMTSHFLFGYAFSGKEKRGFVGSWVHFGFGGGRSPCGRLSAVGARRLLSEVQVRGFLLLLLHSLLPSISTTPYYYCIDSPLLLLLLSLLLPLHIQCIAPT